MKKVILSFLILSLSLLMANAQAPTTPASGLYFDNLDGNAMRLRFVRGGGDNVLIIAKEGTAVTAIPTDGVDYIADVNFGNGNEIAPGEFVVYKGTSTSPTIKNFNFNTTYHYRIYEFNGTNTATEYLTTLFDFGSAATLNTPTSQVSDITFSDVLGYQMTVNWTSGIGGSGAILIAREDDPVNIEPSDLVTYTSHSSYNLNYGNEIGVGNYVIYQGPGTSANITSIDPNKTYHFAIFEYNGFNGKVYLRPGAIAEQISADFPTVAATNFNPYGLDGDKISYNFTRGNGKYRIVIAKEGAAVTAAPIDGTSYTANSAFGSGQDLGGGNFVVSDGASNSSQVSNLNPNTTYYFKVFEYNKNRAGDETYYLINDILEGNATTLAAPTLQATNITFSNLLGTSLTVNCDAGNGTNRIMIVRAGSAVDVTPTDLVSYNASTIYNVPPPSYTNEIGVGNYVLYSGYNNTSPLTNLSPNVTYHFAIFEYNGTYGRVYLAPPVTGSITTPAAPTTQATNLSFSSIDGNLFSYNFTKGNGNKRIVVLKEGAPVSFTPVDGVDYSFSNYLGSATDVGDGNFVIGNTANASGTVYELNPNTTYYIKIFEYNGSGVDTFYLTNTPLEGNQATITYPTTQVSAIGFENVLGESMSVKWTNGNGTGRIVIIRESNPVNVIPIDLVDHQFSGGSTVSFNSPYNEIGTANYVVYKGGASSSGSIINLKPNTTYHFAAFEYNGNSGKMYLVPGSVASQITGTTPTLAASNINFTTTYGDRLSYNFTKGNGAKRIVVAKQGGPVTFTPVDGQEYFANNTFGGAGLGDGNYLVANTTGSSSNLNGLTHSTEYYLKIFEYNGTGANTYYLTTGAPENNQSTISPPTIQTSNYFVNDKTTNSISFSWTKGNGVGRLIIARADTAVDTDPQNYISYSTSQNYGANYTEIGTGNYGVYKGTGASRTLNNLQPNTTYHFACYEFNGNTFGSPGVVYLTPAYTFSVKTKVATPTVQVSSPLFNNIGATSMQIDITKGNGTHRLVLAKKDGAVDTNPTDLISYVANNNFGSGDEIGTGNFVVYNDTGESFLLQNLDHSSTYHFAFYEYAISEDGALYFSPGLTASQIMPTIPQFASTNYTTTPPCTPDVNIEWTVSTAKGRIVIVGESPLNTTPSNATNYTFNFDYGAGSAIGNGFVVYKGTGDLVPINNLLANTIYYVNIFEYNGTEEDPLFNTTPLSGTIGDIIPPTAISKDITIQLDSDGNTSIIATDIDDGSVDTGCGGNTLSIDLSSFDCSNIGSNVVRLTVTDDYGNTNFSDATVTVEDTIKPSLTTVVDKIVEPIGGTCDFALPDYTSETTAIDNCTVQSVTQSPIASTIISGDSTVQTITLTADDGNGNTETITFDVTLDCTVLASDNFELDGFTMYPNPVKNMLTIKNDRLHISKIDIYDLNGKQLKRLSLENNKIDLSDLSTGIYLLKIVTDKGVSNFRILKD